MARELDITIKVENGQAVQALAETDRAIADVETTADKTGGTIERTWQTLSASTQEVADVIMAPDGPRAALNSLGDSLGLTVEQLGLMHSAGLALGAAYGGWQVGRMVADFFDLDQAVEAVARELFGYKDLVIETAGAQMDTINRAIDKGADAAIDYAGAVKFLTDAQNKHLDVMGDYFKRAAALEQQTKEWEKASAKAAAEQKHLTDEMARTLEHVQAIEAGGMHAYGALHQWLGELARDQKYVNDLEAKHIEWLKEQSHANEKFLEDELKRALALDAEVAAWNRVEEAATKAATASQSYRVPTATDFPDPTSLDPVLGPARPQPIRVPGPADHPRITAQGFGNLTVNVAGNVNSESTARQLADQIATQVMSRLNQSARVTYTKS